MKNTINVDGEKYTVKELSEKYNIKISTLNYRINRGYVGLDLVKPLQEKNIDFGYLLGRKFGMLTVVKSYSRASLKPPMVQCICNCGKVKDVDVRSLLKNQIKSCGCMISKNFKKLLTKHDLSKTVEYKIYHGIKMRCYNTNNKKYADYGGRGIVMCDRWLNSVELFIKDMGKRPSIKHSIDRINVDGDYSPSNCRWVLKSVQMNNKRNNIHIEYLGYNLTVSIWCRILNIEPRLIYSRIKNGWNKIDALELMPLPKSKDWSKAVKRNISKNIIVQYIEKNKNDLFC